MNKADSFLRLMDILKKLRAPGGCEWDQEQTHSSLIPYLTEETYEVIEAITLFCFGRGPWLTRHAAVDGDCLTCNVTG